jgi:tRNA (guanosine-2'-O-)-methyltransferase
MRQSQAPVGGMLVKCSQVLLVPEYKGAMTEVPIETAVRRGTMIRAEDRRKLAQLQPEKSSKWPRTDRRQQRIEEVLARRQPDLTIVLENIHDPHNVSAVLRSCDAVGVLAAHTIYTEEQPPDRAYARTTSGSAAKWIEVHRHESVEACYAELHRSGFQILVTALTEHAVDLIDLDLTQPTALVFGNEMRGVSAEALAGADGAVTIPMHGMIESLNISVACAVCLFEAMRQRRLSGAYDQAKLSEAEREQLTTRWLHR